MRQHLDRKFHTARQPHGLQDTGQPVDQIGKRHHPDVAAEGQIHANHFEAIDDNRCRWSSWCNLQLTGLMKYLGLFIRSATRKRTEGDMQRFKLMVESDLAESNE